MRERQALQRVVAAVAPVSIASVSVAPVSGASGLHGLLFGPGNAGGLVDVSADRHDRPLSGLRMGIGILARTCVPGIETGLSRFLTLVVAPAVERAVTPLPCLGQARVAGRAPDGAVPAGSRCA